MRPATIIRTVTVTAVIVSAGCSTPPAQPETSGTTTGATVPVGEKILPSTTLVPQATVPENITANFTFEQALKFSFPNLTNSELACMTREAPDAARQTGVPDNPERIDRQVNVALARCRPADWLEPQIDGLLETGLVYTRVTAECLTVARLDTFLEFERDNKNTGGPRTPNPEFVDTLKKRAADCQVDSQVIDRLLAPPPTSLPPGPPPTGR
jgi:hypothetical protein